MPSYKAILFGTTLDSVHVLADSYMLLTKSIKERQTLL
jgi:hypothetical protein